MQQPRRVSVPMIYHRGIGNRNRKFRLRACSAQQLDSRKLSTPLATYRSTDESEVLPKGNSCSSSASAGKFYGSPSADTCGLI